MMHPKQLLLTLILPPLSVVGYGCKNILIVTILTLLGWLPGVIAAIIVQMGDMPEDTI